MDDIVIIESKDYSQVIFDNVFESYGENCDLECFYTLNELLKADHSDFIGIYKVGFKTSKEYICHQIIDLNVIGESSKGKVIFLADSLPKDDGEFYQFVYVSQSKQIRGASIPFQFKKKENVSDFVEIDEQEAIVIKSKESQINDTISEIKSRCFNLTEANETYEKLIKENEDLIKILKEEVSSVKLRCYHLAVENDTLNSALKNKTENLKSISNSMSELVDENAKLKDKFEYLSNENKNLIDKLQRRINQVETLKNELDTMKANKEELEMILNVKESELSQLRKDKDELGRISEDLRKINDQIIKLETQVDERVNELSKIKKDLKDNEVLVAEQTQTIQAILNERDSLNSTIERITKEKAELELSNDFLSQELLMSKEQLLAAEESKELLRRQLTDVTNELEAVNLKAKMDESTCNELKEKEKHFELENRNLIEEINRLKVDYNTKLEQSNGSYFALHLAHTHLESRIKTIQANYHKDVEECKDKIEKCKQENEVLKQRILAGACEYATLNKKYFKLKRGFDSKIMSHLNSKTNSMGMEADSVLQDKTLFDEQRSGISQIDSSECENTLVGDYLSSSFYSNMNNKEYNNNNNNNHNNIVTVSPYTTLQKCLIDGRLQHRKSCSDVLEDLVCNNANNEHQLRATAASDEQIDERRTILRSCSSQNFTECCNQTNLSNMDSKNLNQQANERQIKRDQEQKTPERKNCEICGCIFPIDLDLVTYEQHMTSHYGPSCPICFLTFRKGYPQADFENHVNNHFTN